jgi:hypothetical protein
MRGALDRYDVGGRLRYIREFIWRGGGLGLEVTRGEDDQVLGVYYVLKAEWPAAVLESAPAAPGTATWRSPVVEGRWLAGTHSYVLWVGIDLRVPSAISVRSQGFVSEVPFAGRPARQVEQALGAELTRYVNAFLDHFQTVPQAAAADAEQMKRHLNTTKG